MARQVEQMVVSQWLELWTVLSFSDVALLVLPNDTGGRKGEKRADRCSAMAHHLSPSAGSQVLSK